MSRTRQVVVTHGDTLKTESHKNDTTIQINRHFDSRTVSGSGFVAVSVATHRKGSRCGMHNHRGLDELFIVTAGRGTIIADGRRYRVEAGDSVMVPATVHHELIGESRELFVVYCVTARAPGSEDDATPWVGMGS